MTRSKALSAAAGTSPAKAATELDSAGSCPGSSVNAIRSDPLGNNKRTNSTRYPVRVQRLNIAQASRASLASRRAVEGFAYSTSVAPKAYRRLVAMTGKSNARPLPDRSVTSGPGHLTATDLVFRYRRGAEPALVGVTLSIDAPGISGLIGPNGAGKSTLLKTWAGIERPSSGSVRVVGVDPWAHRRTAMQSLAYVPQAPAVYGSLSVNDHLALARSERPGFDVMRSRDYLDSLRIPASAKGSQLSGGQRAQLGLAIALGTQAPILLLDEPLANLDPLARRDFLGILRDAAAAAGTTVVLSSHVVSDLEEACDRMIVLGEGAVLLHASIESLLSEHWIIPTGASMPTFGRQVATFVGRDRANRRLWQAASTPSEASAASMEDIVVGYLSLGRDRSLAHVG